MFVTPIRNTSMPFAGMGKIAYKTVKTTTPNGLNIFTTTVTKGGRPISEISRCKDVSHEAVAGYKEAGKKRLDFYSFFDLAYKKHAMSITFSDASENASLKSARYSLPWKINDKKLPTFNDFYKFQRKIDALFKNVPEGISVL